MLCSVSDDVLKSAVALQQDNPDRQLGEILVAQGSITQGDLVEALELQRYLRNGKAALAMARIANRQIAKGRHLTAVKSGRLAEA